MWPALFQILPKSRCCCFLLPLCPLVPLALWPHFSSFTTSCTYFCYFRPAIRQGRRTFWKSEGGGGELKYSGPNLPPAPTWNRVNLPRPWYVPKGQLILKANFEVFIWTKNRTKIFLYFCPSSLKWIKSKKNGIIILDDE